MVKVEFLGPIGKAPMEIDAANLKEIAVKLGEDPELSVWIANCAVAVNDTMVSDLETPLNDGDRVLLLPPVCGG